MLNSWQSKFKSEEMCETSKTESRFPLQKAPENHSGKFPFMDSRFYMFPDSDENQNMKEVRMGYVAQLSLEFLESTGRKPELENVPWLEAASSKGKR